MTEKKQLSMTLSSHYFYHLMSPPGLIQIMEGRPTVFLGVNKIESKYTAESLGSARVPIKDAVRTAIQSVLPSPNI